jgi:hypothetical protein
MEPLPERVEFATQCGRESGADAEALHDIRLPRGDRGNVVILAKRIGPASAPAPETG